MEKITTPPSSPQKEDQSIPTAGTPQSPPPSENPPSAAFSIQELAKETSEVETGKKKFRSGTTYIRKQKNPEKVIPKGADEPEAERDPPQGSSQEPLPNLELAEAEETEGGEKEAEGSEEHEAITKGLSSKSPEKEPDLEEKPEGGPLLEEGSSGEGTPDVAIT